MTRCAPGESMLANVAVAGPPTASRPRDIGVPPVAIWICFGRSGDSTPTKSTPSFSISGISSDRLTIPTTLRSRDFAIAIRHRATWEFAAFNTIQSLDSYSVQSENLFLTYSCRQKVDDFLNGVISFAIRGF